MLPLHGITVVAIEQAIAAPFATRNLADLGARVIKIERPDGGDFARRYDTTVRGLSSHFVWVNRSKQSCAINLKDPGAAEVIQRLLERSDVFVQNLAPGAADRLGLGSDRLRARHPSLIVCNLSGYGPDGPYSDKKAYDLLIQSECGVLAITGTPETPAKAGIAVADIAGGMYAFAGILAALFQRARTGEGCVVNVSLFEALGEWMGYPMYYTMYGGAPPQRTGAAHATVQPYGPFVTGDGQDVYLSVQNEREWLNFCQHVLKDGSLATDERFRNNSLRMAHHDALRQCIEEVFARLTGATVIARLDDAQIANAKLRTVDEFVAHPQLRARNRWRQVDSPVGPLEALVPPAIPNDEEARWAPIPSVGQHTEAILVELGYEHADIQRMRECGVVG
jgi:itaconate CoA-transferase